MKAFFTLFLLTAGTLFIKPATVHAQAADVSDSLALVDLYNSTHGPGWTKHTNWLTGPVKTWYGINLDSNGKVTKLLLDSNNLSGSVPSALGNLTKAQYIYLNSNKLRGQIPGAAFDNLSRIQVFDLEENYFTFDDVTLLPGTYILDYMYLSNHNLPLHISDNNNLLSVSAGGTYAKNWYNLASTDGLKYPVASVGDSILRIRSAGKYQVFVTNADISSNRFTLYTSISDRLVPTADYYDSVSLTSIYAETSHSGPWKDQGGWFTTAPVKTWKGVTLDSVGRVTKLSLPGNDIAGPIPYYNLPALTELDLSDNHLTGNFDIGVFIFPLLKKFNLNNNNSTGFNILNSALPVKYLTDIELAHNNITGPVPFIFSKSHVTTLNLSYNHISGSIHCDAPEMQYLYLDHNNLDTGIGSIASKSLKVIDVRFNNLTWFVVPKLSTYIKSVLLFEPQNPLPLHLNNKTLSVTPRYFERASYVDYAWYKDSTYLKTIVGDSTLKITEPGRYSAILTDEYLPAGFRLFSDTFEITAAELPVTLTTFTGQFTHGQAYLNWQTATELNSAYFGLQRSIDGTNFTTVGKVAAAGTSAIAQNYKFTDALTGLVNIPAQLYYRLQQVDKDGKQSMSKTIVLTPTAGTSSSLIMYPNPVHGILNLRLKDVPGNAAITISDAGGKTLLAQTAKTVPGGQTISLNTARLAAGVYVVRVQYNGQSEEQKFVKE